MEDEDVTFNGLDPESPVTGKRYKPARKVLDSDTEDDSESPRPRKRSRAARKILKSDSEENSDVDGADELYLHKGDLVDAEMESSDEPEDEESDDSVGSLTDFVEDDHVGFGLDFDISF